VTGRRGREVVQVDQGQIDQVDRVQIDRVQVDQMQIGEVAERTGLSQRTIRYYEEIGLVTPTSRSAGGFRLYSETDVARLRLVQTMKPLDFSLDEMRDVLDVLEGLGGTHLVGAEREVLVGRLESYREAADGRVRGLREQLDIAVGFASDLRGEIARQRELTGESP
jgi:DNA-binding transcriptional MerR regulator